MNKTKSQLRAEAVERLENYERRKHKNLARCMLGDRYEDVSFEANRLMLIDLLTDDAHESRGSYEERLYDVPVSDCPYCGCKRVVIHDFSDIYEEPHSYRVEHVDEKDAFNAGCFETYYSFDSVEKAVEHANMRDPLTDDKLPEGDVAAILRKAAIYDGDYSGPGEALRRLTDSTTVYYALETLADMIERDYVRRETDVTGTQYASNDGMEQESCVSKTVRNADSYHLDIDSEAVNGKDCESLPDSRDKLEADVLDLLRWVAESAVNWSSAKRAMDYFASDAIRLLDRQAAITQDETIHDYNIAARESGRILRDEIAELQAERDMYRDKLGRAIDAANEIARMVDE